MDTPEPSRLARWLEHPISRNDIILLLYGVMFVSWAIGLVMGLSM